LTGAELRPKRRSYRSPRRQEQAAETRELVLSAASRLFGAKGWSATGMRDVAREAGVAVETVYANFRSKSELLMTAIDVGVVGDAEPAPLADRPEFSALAAGSIADRVAAAARLVTDVNQRTSGLRRALSEAAVSEPALAAKLIEGEQRRLINVEQAAELITGQPIDPATRDAVWAVTSVDMFHLLTGIAGWSPSRYQEWLATLIQHMLSEQGRRST
jgi:AcrR family transcriptional regulator